MAGAATYRAAGVNTAAASRLLRAIKPLAARTRRPELVAGIGGFAGLLRLPKGYRRPLLAVSADGVGTKLRVAIELKRHATVGIDLVAMNVNDVLTVGAEPIAFLDYLAAGRLRPAVAAEVLRGVVAGCRQADCVLIGGETAEMPSFYAASDYDLAGFAIGVVEADRLVDGRRVRAGDVMIGLRSSGMHSNGFSLARKVLLERARLSLRRRPQGWMEPLGETLLAPTRIYARLVRQLLQRHAIKAMAHITGGGLLDNLPRVLPRSCEAVIFKGSWPVPPVFSLIQELGMIREREMYRTFNMGVGYVVIVGRREGEAVMRSLAVMGEEGAAIIGAIGRGRKRVRLVRG